jgi:hypothetical protein
VAFEGQLQQNFVVLHYSCPPVFAPWSGGKLGLVLWDQLAGSQKIKENWLVKEEALEQLKKKKWLGVVGSWGWPGSGVGLGGGEAR